MGRVKDILVGLVNKASDYLDKPSLDSYNSSLVLEEKSDQYVMLSGTPLSQEESIEQNKMLIRTLDYKFSRILEMIDELNPDLDVFHEMATQPTLMKTWLAHISYSKRIHSFNTYIKGYDKNLLDPKVLASKELSSVKGTSNIKCITDLPLQKKLLS